MLCDRLYQVDNRLNDLKQHLIIKVFDSHVNNASLSFWESMSTENVKVLDTHVISANFQAFSQLI